MKKAFTLIELLAVIIILAVIALIATPIVLNVVSDAREKAKVESANGIIDAANLYVSESMLDDTKTLDDNIYDSIIDNIKGEKPDSGEVYINELNQVAVALKYGDSCYKKDYTETTPKKVEDDDCTLGTAEVATDASCFTYKTNEIASYDVGPNCSMAVQSVLGWTTGEAVTFCSGGEVRGGTLTRAITTVSTDMIQQLVSYNAISNVVTRDVDGVIITGYTCSDTEVVIPSKIDDKTVITIGSQAFNNKTLTSVSIPNKVEYIGIMAFAGNQLTSVKLSSSLKTIEAGAFRDNRLTKVVIPNNVQSIEEAAFWSNQLTSVTIGNKVQKIGRQAFQSNQLTSVAIPNSVTTIGDAAFSGNQLTSVIIPDGVETIGDYAFSWNQLTSVNIPNSIETIGLCVFDSSDSTHTLNLNGVTYVNNPNLSSITIDKASGSIDGEPWGASNATITYLR